VKVLHLFGDWKWTGPAEPTLDLCVELRALGADVAFACQPAPPEGTSNIPARARERGIEPDHSFAFNRAFNIRDNIGDASRIRERCDRDAIDILHVHFTHDHLIGALGSRKAKRPPRIVRTNHRAAALPWYLRRWTDGYLTFWPPEYERRKDAMPTRLIAPGMRLERFDPARAPHEDMRAAFKVPPDAFVLGVVARMQRHRRFDVLLEGVAIARRSLPNLRVLVVGRGTHMKEVAVEPARALGLADVVTFTGYLSTPAATKRDRYPDTVAAFDALLFLVPGSDGTCRALREAMAMGKPAIGARRGLIPDIVDDGATGLVIDDTPQNIADAIVRLASDPARRADMGRRAREKALAQYDIRTQAREIHAFYTELLK
jgi:L-malate glycosyltransferase